MSPEPAPRRLPGLLEAPARIRLPIACFLAGILAFYLLAQVKVVSAVGGGERIPGVSDILWRYHGDPLKTKLHHVLDPSLAETDSKRMSGWLGVEEPERAANRALLLGWVERGAKESEWDTVAPVFGKCTSCHSVNAEGSGVRRDLPFDRWVDVLPVTRGSDGIPFGELATTSHNHLFGFLVASLLVSTIFGATRWRGPLAASLVVGAFAGALVDVASWWLTKWYGAPWHWFVFLGGLVFGLCLTGMAALALDELVLRGRVGRLLERPLARLSLARRDAG